MALLCSKCDKDNCKGYYSYSFQTGGLAIYPAADSIRLGDTIWVVYDEPLAPIDLLSGDSIDLSGGSNFIDQISVGKFNTIKPHERALNKFTVGKIYGIIDRDKTFPDKVLTFKPEIVGKRLISKIYLIPLEKGDFQFGSNDVAPVKLNTAPKDFCGGASFKIPFANQDIHRWIHQLYVDSNYIFSWYDDEHTYSFRVY